MDDLYSLLTTSFVDFRDHLAGTTTDVLNAVRAQLVTDGSNRTTDFGIAAIDAELTKRTPQ